MKKSKSRDPRAVDIAQGPKQRGVIYRHRPGNGFMSLFADLKRQALEEALVGALRRGDLGDWRDPAALKKRRAAAMTRGIAELADKLRRDGIRAPIRQAREEVAKEYHVASGPALKKRLSRYRKG